MVYHGAGTGAEARCQDQARQCGKWSAEAQSRPPRTNISKHKRCNRKGCHPNPALPANGISAYFLDSRLPPLLLSSLYQIRAAFATKAVKQVDFEESTCYNIAINGICHRRTARRSVQAGGLPRCRLSKRCRVSPVLVWFHI